MTTGRYLNRVVLTPAEMTIAATAGIMRQIENLGEGRHAAHGSGDLNDWQLHIEGCLGECALAKYLGIYWDGKGEFRHPDVGNMDVRTATRDHYRLILHKDDPDDRKFWLLCGVNGSYMVKGWILGVEGKIDKYWADPGTGRPAYFVPQSALHVEAPKEKGS